MTRTPNHRPIRQGCKQACKPAVGRRFPLDLAAAVALTCLSAWASAAGAAGTPAAIIAAQIRAQGYVCRQPVAATRYRHAAHGVDTVWLLRCANARYRVRLVPDMAAQVTQLN
jgi:hypothetical protein